MILRARSTIDCEAGLPGFAAAYLRTSGDECAFIESYTSHSLPRLLGALSSAGKRVEDVRYVVVTHAHLDHAAGASALLRACPNATLLAHPRAARHLIDPAKLVAGATAVYGEARFAQLYGAIEPIPKERVSALEDGAFFDLGGDAFRVWHTLGHANHHFVVHDTVLDCVYTGDTFGLVYPQLQGRGRFALPSTSPTGFDPVEARKSIQRVLDLHAKEVCLTHFDAYTEQEEIARQLIAYIDEAEAWLEAAAASGDPVEVITDRLRGAWRGAIEAEAASRFLALDAAALRVLEVDIDLNAQGVAFAAIQRRAARAGTRPA